MSHVDIEDTPPPLPRSMPFPALDSGSTSLSALAALSRNAAVISSSSSSSGESNSSSSSLLLQPPVPVRPGPVRTFSSPRTSGSLTPRAPMYLSKEGLSEREGRSPASRSKPRSNSGRLGPDDFEFGDILGEGSYSTVMKAIYPPTKRCYAIKVIDKEPLIRKNLVRIVNTERNALVRLSNSTASHGGHHGIIKLHWSFQDEWSWYLVLTLVPNGTLSHLLSHLPHPSLPLSTARWYTAQLVDAIAFIHSLGVVHRDMKLENILLDENWRVVITDFGSAELSGDAIDESTPWVGTPLYVPPELLNEGKMCKSSDFWALGCIIFQFLTGILPFQGGGSYLMWAKVRALDYSFPDGFDESAKKLVEKLLVLDPAERFGTGPPGSPNGLEALKTCSFFENIDWTKIWEDDVPGLADVLKNEEMDHESYTRAELNSNTPSSPEESYAHVHNSAVEYGDENVNTGVMGIATSGEGYNGSNQRHKANKSARLKQADLPQPDSCSSSDVDAPPSQSDHERSGLSSQSHDDSTQSDSPSEADDSRINGFMSTAFALLRPTETPFFSEFVYEIRSTSSRGLTNIPLAATALARRTKLLSLKSASKKSTAPDTNPVDLYVSTRANKKSLRLLILTKGRLLCFKRTKKAGGVVMCRELLIGGQGGGESVIVEIKNAGDRAFILKTVSKSYTYTTDEPKTAIQWVQEVEKALPSFMTSSN